MLTIQFKTEFVVASMILVEPNHFSDPMSRSAAAAPPFPAITSKIIRSQSFTSVTLQKPLNTKHKLGSFELHYSLNRNSSFSQYLFLSAFSVALLILRLTSTVVLPDFPHHWRQLIAFTSRAEAELIDAPDYLFDAAVAYEDRGFFSHFGVDAIGVARAVLSLSARGGGSTITQQLVKNTLLKNERTFLRKFVEMVLALELERRFSKLSILSAYLCKGPRMPMKLEKGTLVTEKDSWDSKRESYIWKMREEIEKWAISFRSREFERTSDLMKNQLPSQKDGTQLLLSVLHHPI